MRRSTVPALLCGALLLLAPTLWAADESAPGPAPQPPPAGADAAAPAAAETHLQGAWSGPSPQHDAPVGGSVPAAAAPAAAGAATASTEPAATAPGQDAAPEPAPDPAAPDAAPRKAGRDALPATTGTADAAGQMRPPPATPPATQPGTPEGALATDSAVAGEALDGDAPAEAPDAPALSVAPDAAGADEAAQDNGDGAPDDGTLAGDGGDEHAAQAGHDQQPSSTIELLDEDTNLEHAQDSADGSEADTADAAVGDGATADDGAAAEAAALTPPDDGSEPTPETATTEEDSDLFPSSPGIEKQKAFWIKIFTRYNSHQGVLHDGRIALPVYESVDLTGMSYRRQRRYVRHRKRQVAARLHELARALKTNATLDDAQQALLKRLPPGSTPRDLVEYANNVRFQRGLADRFRDGVIESGALLERMQAILERHGVPKDLAYLPHVESSFNNATRSKYGASGIWQFTRSTGRIFMTVGYEVDERLDPIIASEAAAKFLRQNYEKLGNWPLAITAYNHGPQSLQRITQRMGTRDLGVLIEEYDGRLFKFASKNFYAEFLAAREVARHYRRYFGELELEPPLRFEEVELPSYVDAQEAADTLGVELSRLRRLNPALRHPVWSGAKYIPPHYRLRIPPRQDPQRFLAALPDDAQHDKQKRSMYVRVARGDTLYSIGRRHGISWRAIALANNISSYRRLRPGQKLILPWDGTQPPPQIASQSSDDGNGSPPALEHVVERLPVPASAPWSGGLPVDGDEDVQADRFQELRIVRYDARRKEGEIVAAYGETVGAYAEWAGITANELRAANGMSYRSVLRPGRSYVIPLDAVTPEEFEQHRMDFHREREKSFFAEYDITEKVKVEVQQGQSPWALAQDNNVPMWLFYRENPELLTQPLRVGMEVILPIVQAGARTP